jgi:hypothetical protein
MLRTFTRFLYTRKMLDADPLWVALNKRKSPSEAQLYANLPFDHLVFNSSTDHDVLDFSIHKIPHNLSPYISMPLCNKPKIQLPSLV